MPDLYDEKCRWEDPDSESPAGLLLSDRIQYYVKKVRLVHPFDPEDLAPAAYSLHAGKEYYIDEVKHEPENGIIIIPSNGLIYLRLAEEINLPHYIAAQHNLGTWKILNYLL